MKKSIQAKENKLLPKTRIFKHSGLAVIRERFQDREIIFIGNAMPLGMLPLCPHGHMDALSFWLSVEGKEIFVDPGTYLYHSGGKWRKYFRSTAAHNTLRINKKDMTTQVADFMFGKPYKINKFSLNESENEIRWQAGHDAYEKLKVPVSHLREVIYQRDKGKFEIDDSLQSKEKYFIEQSFHLHPGCSLNIDGNEIFIDREDVRLKIEVDNRLRVELFKGSEEPLLGWYSKKFNHIEETNTIVCSGNMDGNVKLKTLIATNDTNEHE